MNKPFPFSDDQFCLIASAASAIETARCEAAAKGRTVKAMANHRFFMTLRPEKEIISIYPFKKAWNLGDTNISGCDVSFNSKLPNKNPIIMVVEVAK